MKGKYVKRHWNIIAQIFSDKLSGKLIGRSTGIVAITESAMAKPAPE